MHTNSQTKEIPEAKVANLMHLFGTLKTGMSGQAFKDMVRKGWML